MRSAIEPVQNLVLQSKLVRKSIVNVAEATVALDSVFQVQS